MKRAVKKNTGIYNIFGALIVLALVGLSIVVVNVLKNKNDTYVIPAGSTVYDINNEYIPLDNDAKLYMKADGNCYLKTTDKYSGAEDDEDEKDSSVVEESEGTEE